MANNQPNFPNQTDVDRARQFHPNPQQQFNQNQQQFNQNQQQFNQGQFGFFPNQFPFFNMPQMTEEQRIQYQQQMEQQQKMYNEMMRQQAIQIGKTLKQQKQMMEQLNRNRIEREKQRQTCEMVIFFKYNDDMLPITVKADQFLSELLQEYMTQSGNQNVRFFFHEQELTFNTNSPTVLHEIKGLRTGEEIIVKAA